MAKYDVTKQAEDDLINIWLYTNETWSIDQADQYYDLLIEEFILISENPMIGKSYNTIMEGARGLILNHHTIFYWIQPNGIIEILRILNHSEDIPNKL